VKIKNCCLGELSKISACTPLLAARFWQNEHWQSQWHTDFEFSSGGHDNLLCVPQAQEEPRRRCVFVGWLECLLSLRDPDNCRG